MTRTALDPILERLEALEKRVAILEAPPVPVVVEVEAEQAVLPGLGFDVDIANLFAGKWPKGVNLSHPDVQKTLCEIHRRAWRMPRAINPLAKDQVRGIAEFIRSKRTPLDVAHAIVGMRVEETKGDFDRRHFNGFWYLAKRFDHYVNLGVTKRGPVLRARIIDGRWRTEEHVWLDSEGDHR